MDTTVNGVLDAGDLVGLTFDGDPDELSEEGVDSIIRLEDEDGSVVETGDGHSVVDDDGLGGDLVGDDGAVVVGIADDNVELHDEALQDIVDQIDLLLGDLLGAGGDDALNIDDLLDGDLGDLFDVCSAACSRSTKRGVPVRTPGPGRHADHPPGGADSASRPGGGGPPPLYRVVIRSPSRSTHRVRPHRRCVRGAAAAR